MSFTLALIGPFTREFWRERVEQMLLNEGSIQVVAVKTWEEVTKILNSNSFDVLIAEFAMEGAPSIDAIHAEFPTIAVASVNSSAFDTHFINLNGQQFVELIARLGRRTAGQEATDWLEPIEAAEGTNNVIDFDRTSEAEIAVTTHGEHLAVVSSWLDAALSLVLEKAVGLAGGRDIAGLTMDPQTARVLLGVENSRRNREELQQEMRAIEARLTARRDPRQRQLPALQLIENRFQLDPIDSKIFWLTLAPEIDDRFARAIGVINDDLGRRRPTVALVAAAIDEIQGEWDVATRLGAHRPLARGGLVTLDPIDTGTLPRSQSGLISPPDIVEFVMTGVPVRPRSAWRLAA